VLEAAVQRMNHVSRHGVGASLLAISIILIGGTTVEGVASDLSVVLAGFGTCALVAAGLILGPSWTLRTGVITASIASFGMMVCFLARFSFVWTAVPVVLVNVLVAAVIGVAALFGRQERQFLIVGLAVVGILFLTLQGMRHSYSEPSNIDVYVLHEQAAAALREGQNPYTTGNVHVLETYLTQDPEVISEYTYPPLALVAYAGSSILFGDSRMAGAIAIPVALALVLWFVGRRWSATDRGEHFAVAVVALLIMNPMNFFIVYAGWTEAIALPFLVVSAALWTKKPFVSALMLGLAFASKQYFIVAVPLLFFLPDPYRWKRVGVVGATTFLTFVPFLLWDAGGLINGVARHHLTRPPRSDALSLGGVGIDVPIALGVGLAAVVGILVARRAIEGGMALLAVGSVIAVFTFFSVRGFRNTWWLVVAMASVAIGFLGSQYGPTAIEDPC